MKAFEINRDSWHYKLNKNFFNNYEGWMERWEEKHADFCSYWRATFFRMMWIAVLFSLGATIVSVIGVGLWTNPVEVILGFLLSVAVLGVCVGIPITIANLQRRRAARMAGRNDPPSLFKQKYQAWKGRYCPAVEYKANE